MLSSAQIAGNRAQSTLIGAWGSICGIARAISGFWCFGFVLSPVLQAGGRRFETGWLHEVPANRRIYGRAVARHFFLSLHECGRSRT
jgi:hypothetical protein